MLDIRVTVRPRGTYSSLNKLQYLHTKHSLYIFRENRQELNKELIILFAISKLAISEE